MEDYCSIIRNILNEVVSYENFDYETDLIEGEIMKSLELMYLVTELEDKFNIIFPEEEVTLENFRSIRKISELVQKLVVSKK